MNYINEIEIEHINRLTDIQLSKLLHRLLQQEALRYNLPNPEITVPFNITTSDGGSDGKITWYNPPEFTKWIKNSHTIFQNKATDLIPSQCEEEILMPNKEGESRVLKPEVDKVVSNNGSYILFTNKSITDKGKNERIAGFRKAIQKAGYTNFDSLSILVYDANSIKDWTNQYTSAVLLVQEFNGISRPRNFITWQKWEILAKAKDNKFEIDLTIKTNIKLIHENIDKEKVIRVTGHSGLGKTRVVLEAFRNIQYQNCVAYVNLEGSDNIIDIKSYILTIQDTQDGVLVIDNCNYKNHIILSDIVKPMGNIKIITIGIDDNQGIDDLKIKIERNNQRDIVKEIVISKIGKTHQPSDIEYVTSISEGYPWMAIRFCDSIIKNGMEELNKLPIESFIKKLIFGNNEENEIEYNVIRACSVFTSFGFEDDSFKSIISKELRDIIDVQKNYIRTKIIDEDIKETKFNEICRKYTLEDILERRGTSLVVKPTILAIHLAADWLTNTNSKKIIQIIQELKDINLQEKFIERLKDLDQLDKAKEIVSELWGENSPFGSAEVLNTSWGSMLFRYVVEVNPISMVNTLENSFGNLSSSDLRKIVEGRRNLVWSLEKLCFRKETFFSASKILFSFAVAENETWGNNSLNQFKQLFQVYLSGTEANLLERLDVINWGLKKSDPEYTQVAIEAIGRGLINDYYTRIGGSEKQGSSAPLVEYVPNGSEVLDYWNEILSILTNIACCNNSYASLAKEKIALAIRSLIRSGGKEIILESIEKIINVDNGLWADAITHLKLTLAYDNQLEEEDVIRINCIINRITPVDLKTQFFLKVTKPDWDSFEKEGEEFIDKPLINVLEFASKLVDEKLNWFEFIPNLLVGEQRQAFNFGEAIGGLIANVDNLVELSVKYLRLIPKSDQNPEFLAGILSHPKNKTIAINTIDKLILDEDLRHHCFYLTKISNPNFVDIDKLFVLVDKYNFSINYFINLQYGRALKSLETNEILNLCDKIARYGNNGNWTALSILYMYSYHNKVSWIEYKSFIEKLISSTNMLIDIEKISTMDGHYWSETVNKILLETNNHEFAVIISKQIVEFCSQFEFNYSFTNYLSKVIHLLFENYFEIIWSYFGEGIIGNYITFFHLKYIIGNRNGNLIVTKNNILEKSQQFEVVLNWCRNNNDIAPKRIANFMTLGVEIEGKYTWHPFAKAIIDEYGENDKVLDEISANMGSFGMVGSTIPYYLNQKELLVQLKNHSNTNVKQWAIKLLKNTERKIILEKLEEEERNIR